MSGDMPIVGLDLSDIKGVRLPSLSKAPIVELCAWRYDFNEEHKEM